jgi:hypothetical protein
MIQSTDQVVENIKAFDAVRDGWSQLDALVKDLRATKRPEAGIDALLGVVERYPDTSGGALMSVLHALETIPGYQVHVIESLRRKPSVIALMMVNRMLNSDITDVGAQSLMQLLHETKAHPGCRGPVKAELESVLEGRLS